MTTTDWDPWRASIVAYRKWLDAQRPETCKRFLDRLRNPNVASQEGAVCEAVAWDWLASRCEVELRESESDGGPDFLCRSTGNAFIVEVTALTTDAGSKATGLEAGTPSRAKFYKPATGALKRKIIRKAKQVAAQECPVVVFVPTLHFEVSAVAFSKTHLQELLIGSTVIHGSFDPDTGGVEIADTELATMDHPLFMRTRTCEPLRQHISAVIVGGFGLHPPSCVVHGLLNQHARRPFDPAWLADLSCGRVEPWPPRAGPVSVVWSDRV